MGQKAPSQRQARQVSGLGGDAFIQQTVKQSQLDGRGQIVQVKTTAEVGATQAQMTPLSVLTSVGWLCAAERRPNEPHPVLCGHVRQAFNVRHTPWRQLAAVGDRLSYFPEEAIRAPGHEQS
jgi:hypothetical protein